MEFADILSLMKTLADPARLRILGLTARRDHNVQELAALLRLSEPTISHHLAPLRDHGLVVLRIDGNMHWYRLEQAGLTKAAELLAAPGLAETLADGLPQQSWEEGVLAASLGADGRLIDLPTPRTKRRVVLAWIARQIDGTRDYAAAELDAVLVRFLPDAASLRRDLLTYRFIARQSGRYRVRPEAAAGGG